jgi:hypothetical protein
LFATGKPVRGWDEIQRGPGAACSKGEFGWGCSLHSAVAEGPSVLAATFVERGDMEGSRVRYRIKSSEGGEWGRRGSFLPMRRRLCSCSSLTRDRAALRWWLFLSSQLHLKLSRSQPIHGQAADVLMGSCAGSQHLLSWLQWTVDTRQEMPCAVLAGPHCHCDHCLGAGPSPFPWLSLSVQHGTIPDGKVLRLLP